MKGRSKGTMRVALQLTIPRFDAKDEMHYEDLGSRLQLKTTKRKVETKVPGSIKPLTGPRQLLGV